MKDLPKEELEVLLNMMEQTNNAITENLLQLRRIATTEEQHDLISTLRKMTEIQGMCIGTVTGTYSYTDDGEEQHIIN